MKNSVKKIANGVINVLFWCVCVCMLMFVLQVCCFTSFKVPTDSMEPTLLPGDQIIVNKFVMGARLFDVGAALQNEAVDIYRMPGLSRLKRNDVVVFNFPYPSRWDSIYFDVMKYYVKRCVALPGDTLEIRNGFYRIRGYEGDVGDRVAQERISEWPIAFLQELEGVLESFPYDKELGWTVKEFGPLPIPTCGQVVAMNPVTCRLYHQLIGWEQKKRLHVKGDRVLLGDSVLTHYQFKENYYFVSGDKAENSQDSRYWGMLPEEFIVGKATVIWKSVNPLTKKIRWNRILKHIE